KDQVGFRLEGKILLEVAGEGNQRVLLAGQQSAVGISHRGLRRGEVDAVQRESLLQLYLLLGRSGCLYDDLRGCIRLTTMAITYVAVHGISSRRDAGGIELYVGARACYLAAACRVAIGERIIVRVTGIGCDAGALTHGDG